jgi:ribosome biogenesis GTPase A
MFFKKERIYLSLCLSLFLKPAQGSIPQTLEEKFEENRQKIHLALENSGYNKENDTAVALLGFTGSGKSVLINFFGQKNLEAKVDLSDHWHINVSDGEAISEICHLANAGTTLPIIHYDQNLRTVFYDCPGFLTTGTAEDEVLDAFRLYEILRQTKKLKIALALHEGNITDARGGSIKQLSQILSKIFCYNVNSFLESTIIIITNNKSKRLTENRVKDRFKNIAANQVIDFENGNTYPNARALLHGFQAIPVVFFPHPDKLDHLQDTDEGPFLSRQDSEGRQVFDSIWHQLESINSMNGQGIRLGLTERAAKVLEEMSHGLSERANHEMSRLWVEVLQESIPQKIHMCQNPENLRQEFHQLFLEANTLFQNFSLENAQAFENFFQKFEGVSQKTLDSLKNVFSPLHFFEKCGVTLPFTINPTEFLQTLKELAQDPEVSPAHNRHTLFLKGGVIGLSDINKKWYDNRQNVSDIIIESGKALFIDESVHFPGVNMSINVDFIKASHNTVSINLSGRDGQPLNQAEEGQNGAQGENGGDSGSVKIINSQTQFIDFSPEKIQFVLNGGKGVKGQDGGHASGQPRKSQIKLEISAEVNPHIRHNNRINSLNPISGNVHPKTIEVIRNLYEEKPYLRSHGGLLGAVFPLHLISHIIAEQWDYTAQGGQGGVGGQGGRSGYIAFEGSQALFHITAHPGAQGKQGKFGKSYKGLSLKGIYLEPGPITGSRHSSTSGRVEYRDVTIVDPEPYED